VVFKVGRRGILFRRRLYGWWLPLRDCRRALGILLWHASSRSLGAGCVGRCASNGTVPSAIALDVSFSTLIYEGRNEDSQEDVHLTQVPGKTAEQVLAGYKA
jgi:hypothetical protein